MQNMDREDAQSPSAEVAGVQRVDACEATG